MSNITKNLILGLTLVCVIVLIVFSIQLIVLNVGGDPDENGAVAANGEDDEEPTPTPMPTPPPEPTRRELIIGEDQILVIYSDDELFDFLENEYDWWFLYTGGDLATLEIRFLPLSPQGIYEDAVNFLNYYMEGEGAVAGYEESIHGSQITGVHVTAHYMGIMYEAWVHALADTETALVFVINYSNDLQRDALHRLLSSMELMSAIADEPYAPDTVDPDEDDPYYEGDTDEDDPYEDDADEHDPNARDPDHPFFGLDD